jgi:hypothetical protein
MANMNKGMIRVISLDACRLATCDIFHVTVIRSLTMTS